ncbi:unnamed protein product [Rhodiola kirilowii]
MSAEEDENAQSLKSGKSF